MKSDKVIEILKAQKLKNSLRLLINKFFFYYAPLGFGIAEYNDRPIIEKGGSVPENGGKFQKMKSIVPDLSEKIVACMSFEKSRKTLLGKVKVQATSIFC